LPILGLLVWIEKRRCGSRTWRERRAGMLAGIFFAADLLLWHHSIGDVGAGLATVLANIQVVLVPLVAWAILAEPPGRHVLIALIFSESPSAVQAVGVGLVMAALVAVGRSSRPRADELKAASGWSGPARGLEPQRHSAGEIS